MTVHYVSEEMFVEEASYGWDLAAEVIGVDGVDETESTFNIIGGLAGAAVAAYVRGIQQSPGIWGK